MISAVSMERQNIVSVLESAELLRGLGGPERTESLAPASHFRYLTS
jgi:hypothetical protein